MEEKGDRTGRANSRPIKHILKSDSKLSPHLTASSHPLRAQSNDDSVDLKRIDFPFAKAIESDVQGKSVHGFFVQKTTCQCTTNTTKETEQAASLNSTDE